MKVQLRDYYTACCQDELCNWSRGESIFDPSKEANEHYKLTGHIVLVRKIHSHIYRKPTKEAGK